MKMVDLDQIETLAEALVMSDGNVPAVYRTATSPANMIMVLGLVREAKELMAKWGDYWTNTDNYDLEAPFKTVISDIAIMASYMAKWIERHDSISRDIDAEIVKSGLKRDLFFAGPLAPDVPDFPPVEPTTQKRRGRPPKNADS